MTTFRSRNPCRPLDWRNQRVLGATADPARHWFSRSSDDNYVRRRIAFLRRCRVARGDDRAMEEVVEEFEDCFYAQRLAEGRQHANYAMTTSLVEARLLARQSFAEIAALTGTSAAVIEHFEAMYFDVVHRLEYRDWITAQVLVPALAAQVKAAAAQSGVGPVAFPFLDGSTKLFAYFCGPTTIDVIGMGFEGVSAFRTAEEFDTWWDDHWRQMIRRRSVQAAQTFEINKFNVTDVFAAHLRIIDLEQSPGAAKKAKTDFEAGIKAALDSLPYSPATLAGTDYRPGRTREADHLAIELNCIEAGRLAAGEPLKSILDDETIHLTMPPPRRAGGIVDSN